MSAKILVVDDIPANVRLLEAKLQASFYTVLTAQSGAEALRIAAQERPDLILLDVMMPEMNGFECCMRLKADPELATIPVVMVTALDQPSDRLRGLEAGADDFLTKPANDLALFARVRSLVRVKMMIDELRLRDETLRDFGQEEIARLRVDSLDDARVLVVDARPTRARNMAARLQRRLGVETQIASCRREAMALCADKAADAFVISDILGDEDGLELCSQLRSQPETRQAALILSVDDGDYETVAVGLDLGIDDYLMRPTDENEMVARVQAQLRRKRFADRLRENVKAGLRMAMTDALTGLYNRRYADQHLGRQAAARGVQAPVSAMLLDIDHFKTINDSHGHSVGDEVLVEFARRLREQTRGVDLTARYGGEEFLIVMPETEAHEAEIVAERVRRAISQRPFQTSAGALTVSASFGVAALASGESAEALLGRCDRALYEAKNAGRDRIRLAPPRRIETEPSDVNRLVG